jgi:hypothetical protein
MNTTFINTNTSQISQMYEDTIEALLLLYYQNRSKLPKLAKPRVGKKYKYIIVYKNLAHYRSKKIDNYFN